jgi:Uma2 family endonuclease
MSIAVDQWPRRHRIDVVGYYKMAEVGMLAPEARVELIEGEVVDMAPIGSTHAGVVNVLTKSFITLVRDLAVVSVQSPLRLDAYSEPQPDLMLLKPRSDMYKKSHPSASDVLLLIEVSDSTLKFDRGPKSALYAKHGVPEVWVIDLVNKQLHCMREPKNEQYAMSTSLTKLQCIAPLTFPAMQIELATLFD